jgi:hypothetical protein
LEELLQDSAQPQAQVVAVAEQEKMVEVEQLLFMNQVLQLVHQEFGI